MHISRDIEIKAMKFVAGLIIAIAIFCVWLAGAITKR